MFRLVFLLPALLLNGCALQNDPDFAQLFVPPHLLPEDPEERRVFVRNALERAQAQEAERKRTFGSDYRYR